jgi:hypothetical protein
MSPYGKYFANTAGSYSGGGIVSYSGAKTKCALITGASPNVHICTANEISMSLELGTTPAPPTTANTYAWINNGPPAYISDLSNDCKGWTDNNTNPYDTYGSIWDFANKRASMMTCDNTVPIACCSY